MDIAVQNIGWGTALVLSVLLPTGFLAAFRITGISPGPRTVQTITASTASWNMTRPSAYLRISHVVSNAYSDATSHFTFAIEIYDYWEDSLFPPSNGGDCIEYIVQGSANVEKGFIYSMNLRLPHPDNEASLGFVQTSDYNGTLNNLKLAKILESQWGDRDAAYETVGVNQPRNCSLSESAWWVFRDKNTTDHRIDAYLETTYFDGNIFRKVVMPIMLEVLAS